MSENDIRKEVYEPLLKGWKIVHAQLQYGVNIEEAVKMAMAYVQEYPNNKFAENFINCILNYLEHMEMEERHVNC